MGLPEIIESLRSIAASAQQSSDPYERDRADRLANAARCLQSLDTQRSSLTAAFPVSGWDHVGPTLGAQSFVIDDQNRILLARRRGNNRWCIPGGVVEVGESPAATAVRELWEEVGLRGVASQLIGVFNGPDWGVLGNHVVAFAYLIDVDDPTPVHGVEMAATGFFSPSELPEPMQPGHAKAIQRSVECLATSTTHFDPITE